MADTISVKRRSQNMRQIKSVYTKPEVEVCQVLRTMKYRFRLHDKGLPGKPDIVFVRSKRVIEVRGCFWHQHKGCIDSHVPKTKVAYWGPKLRRNVERDVRNLKDLKKLGWRVLVIWECQVKNSNRKQLQRRLRTFLERPLT
jgi:DNA mismatch endonuclease (patch repair protein)